MIVLRVRVSPEDFRLGTPGCGYACPVALAVAGELPGADVSVGRSLVRVRLPNGQTYRGETPAPAFLFIDRYDRRLISPEGFETFEFVLFLRECRDGEFQR